MSLGIRIALFVAGIIGAGFLWHLAATALADLRAGAAARRCAIAAKTADKPLDACAPALRAGVEAARQAAACDDGLGRGDAWRIATSCSAPVKRTVARAAAAEGTAASLRGALAEATRDRDAAVARAEARNLATSRRTATNERTIAALPPRGDGLVHCDAECVRQLAGPTESRP